MNLLLGYTRKGNARSSALERRLLMNPLAAVQCEFRTLYNRHFNTWPTMFEEVKPERLWNLEAEETEKAFVVKMEVPG
jgi:hypothetical protein